MTVRQELERREHRNLNPLAGFADQTQGRPRGEREREQDVRTCYQRDTDKIVHSKAFRRLMHKTQVFLAPEGDHYRTRLTHTLEVAQISRTVARILAYNLSMIFDNVKFVNPTSTSEVFEQMLNISGGDTIVAFSFPRYSSKMVNAVKFASDKGAKVIVITDSENSPLVKYSGYFLCAQSDMASFMDSLVAPLSIINAIIVEITRKKEAEITERFDKLEKIWDEYDVYAKR